MGEVYRARDSRLGRQVAIKVLPVAVSADPRLRARFQREAKAISALNHPNICALHDVGEVSGDNEKSPLQYIVMEYLEGDTLEDRIKRGRLPIEEVFRYGIQIADALDKAHRQHILHRDLKPSNIMISKGEARLFDFGLAKFIRTPTGALPADTTSSAITAEKPITDDGSAIGTLEYMSPEQLRGKEADARSDLFSFGVCLYQMITGRRPFGGNSRADVIAAILGGDPAPISDSEPSCPAALQWLVEECLIKDPDERMQTAHDVLLELRRIRAEGTTQPRKTDRTSRTPRPAVIAAAIAVVVVGALLLLLKMTRSETAKPIRRFSISLPPSAPLASGTFDKLAVSPDGSQIAFIGGDYPYRLYLYSVDSQETHPLPDTDGARGPFFSADGRSIGFYTSDRGLEKITVAKGSPTILSGERDLRGGTWSKDGTIVFAETVSLLRRIPASGGPVETVAAYDPQANVRWPSFLPGGEYVLYTVTDFGADYDRARIVATSLRTGESKTVLRNATCARFVPPGYLAYFHAQTLFAVRFDPQKLEATGTPFPLLDDVNSYFASGLAEFAVSSDGSIFYLPRDPTQSDRELVWVDRSGNSTPITSDHKSYEDPKLSPDGKRLLVTIGPRPHLDLWILDLRRVAWERLTNEGTNETGVWSPDGARIAFASSRNGGFDLYVVPSDMSSAPVQVTSRRSWDFPRSWSPDGKVLTVFEQYRATLRDIFIVSPNEGARPTPLIATTADEDHAVFSPDGHWVAYQSNESGRDEVYVQSYPQARRKWRVSTSGGTNPVWARDGRELFYRSGNRVMSVDLRIADGFVAGQPRMLFRGPFEESFDVTPDGRQFVMVKSPPPLPRTQIDVVLGGFDNLPGHAENAPRSE